MRLIPLKDVGGRLHPTEPFPENATAIVCGPYGYTVYEQGDELPPGAPLDPTVAQRAAIEAERDQRLLAGVEWDGDRWHTDAGFQKDLTAFVVAFGSGILPATAKVGVRTTTNTTRQLDKAQVTALAGAVMQYVQGVFNWSWAEKDKL